MSETFIYLAGPMNSSGRATQNVHKAVKIAARLMNAGFAVYVPQTFFLFDAISPRTPAEWLVHDLKWLAKCDLVLRLDGESHGADNEAYFAMKRGIDILRESELEEIISRGPEQQYGLTRKKHLKQWLKKEMFGDGKEGK